MDEITPVVTTAAAVHTTSTSTNTKANVTVARSTHYDDVDLSNPRLKFTPDVLRDLVLPRGLDHFTTAGDNKVCAAASGAGGRDSASVSASATQPPLVLRDRVFSTLMGSPVGNDVLEIEET